MHKSKMLCTMLQADACLFGFQTTTKKRQQQHYSCIHSSAADSICWQSHLICRSCKAWLHLLSFILLFQFLRSLLWLLINAYAQGHNRLGPKVAKQWTCACVCTLHRCCIADVPRDGSNLPYALVAARTSKQRVLTQRLTSGGAWHRTCKAVMVGSQ